MAAIESDFQSLNFEQFCRFSTSIQLLLWNQVTDGLDCRGKSVVRKWVLVIIHVGLSGGGLSVLSVIYDSSSPKSREIH